MNSANTMKAISTIALLAKHQIELVESDAASSSHTKLVLAEIVERCAKITPSKEFYRVDLSDDESLVKDLEGVVGFCDATHEEVHGIWSRFVDHRVPPVTWQQNSGHGRCIGHIDGRDIFVSLIFNTIAGHRICFYNATSAVVDHDMVRAYIEAIAPDSAKIGGKLNHSDATNFANVLPRGWQTA